jgi:hypothetical protein
VDAAKPVVFSQTATQTKGAAELKEMTEQQAPAPEIKDKFEYDESTATFKETVVHYTHRGADISSKALGGLAGLTLAGIGMAVGFAGGSFGGVALTAGPALAKASLFSEGFTGFFKSLYQTSTTAAALGGTAGVATVGYGSWQMGKTAGSVVAALPGAILGGAIGVGIALRNKLTGGDE